MSEWNKQVRKGALENKKNKSKATFGKEESAPSKKESKPKRGDK